ncbi:MAG: hypothetical protein AAB360_01970 [Patescibacteria group bacterium]
MRKILAMLGLALVLAPAISLAADFRVSESGAVTIEKNDSLGNAYLAGNTINIDGAINNDLVAAGSAINIDGTVNQSTLIAGNTINQSGAVSQNARYAGNNVTISGQVGQDLVAAGRTVNVRRDAAVAGDAMIAGNAISIDGRIGNTLYLSGENVRIDGRIGGDVVAKSVGRLEIGPDAQIGGNLRYSSEQEAVIAGAAEIGGEIEFDRISQPAKQFAPVATATNLLSSFLLLIALVYLLPRFSRNVRENAYRNKANSFLANLGTGFILLLLSPLAIITLAISVIGARLALLVGVIYLLLLVLAASYSVILAGDLIIRTFVRDQHNKKPWLITVTGLLAAFVASLIPLVGWLAIFVFFLAALGALTKTFKNIFLPDAKRPE